MRRGRERARCRPGSGPVLFGLLPLGERAAAQQPWARWGGRAVPVLTAVDPVPGGGSLAELRLVQPIVWLTAGAGTRVRLRVTLDLEGLTMPRGELTPGAWGEGFVDRRHPHTDAHELMLEAPDLLGPADGRAALSLAAGKGFAPFGTDDPMMRPPLRYPVAGTDQVKWSLSAGRRRPTARLPVTGLAEWARTSETDGFFVFHSLLLEGAWHPGRQRLYYRLERTERPEEERISFFRSRRPHLENSILGTTRWTIHTVGWDLGVTAAGGVALRPGIELSGGRVRGTGGGVFDVERLYGRDRFWSLTLGVRISAGPPMPAMGRYGAADASDHHQH